MPTTATRAEPRAQAISWLVAQLRWEETLGELRHAGNGAGRDETARAA